MIEACPFGYAQDRLEHGRKIARLKKLDNLAKMTDLWYNAFWHIHGSNDAKWAEINEHKSCFVHILI